MGQKTAVGWNFAACCTYGHMPLSDVSVVMSSWWRGKHLLLHHLLGCFQKHSMLDCFNLYTAVQQRFSLLWFRQKYLNNYWMYCHKIWYIYIYGAHMINPTDFGDLLTSPLVPPWSSNVWFWVKYHNNKWMECHDIWYRHSCFSLDDTWLTPVYISY